MQAAVPATPQVSTSFHVDTPAPFNFTCPHDWPKWRRRFERFRYASGLSAKPEEEQVNALIYLMGDTADDIFLSFSFRDDAEKKQYAVVMQKYEDHFVIRKNVIYERATFNSRVQHEGELVEEFITACRAQIEKCEYGALQDELLRDRIVVGVLDKALSEKMQLDGTLTLEKAISTARQAEEIRRQQKVLHSGSTDNGTPATIEKLGSRYKFSSRKEKQPHDRPYQFNQFNDGAINSSVPTACMKCGNSEQHNRERCPANRAKCRNCGRMGHYERVCFGRAANFNREITTEDTTDDLRIIQADMFLGAINATISQERWMVNIAVNDREVVFRIDTGADVCAIPATLYNRQFQDMPLQKSDRRLFGPGKMILSCEGRMAAELSSGDISMEDEIYVINGLEVPLLSLKASENLRKVQRLDEVQLTGGSKLRPKEDYPGLGRVARETKTQLEPEATPNAVAIPRRCLRESTNRNESLKLSNLPERPWHTVSIDMLHHAGKHYLVIIDQYSKFIEAAPMKDQTTKTVINMTKEVFSRRGIPEIVQRDNGTNLSATWTREFADYAKAFGFKSITSSPKYPQSNGLAEAAVKIVKNLLKKSEDLSQGLLAYRSTPMTNGFSPAQLLMNRRLRTRLPTTSISLRPQIPPQAVVREKAQSHQQAQKRNFDRHHGVKELPELQPGDRVWIIDMRREGTIVRKAEEPRSYIIETTNGNLRRNRFHLITLPGRRTNNISSSLSPQVSDIGPDDMMSPKSKYTIRDPVMPSSSTEHPPPVNSPRNRNVLQSRHRPHGTDETEDISSPDRSDNVQDAATQQQSAIRDEIRNYGTKTRSGRISKPIVRYGQMDPRNNRT